MARAKQPVKPVEPDLDIGLDRASPTNERPRVKVGSIVLFLQPVKLQDVSNDTHVKLPMMVTRVHNDGLTVDGMVFSAGGNVPFTGMRDVYDVVPGESDAQWMPMQHGA